MYLERISFLLYLRSCIILLFVTLYWSLLLINVIKYAVFISKIKYKHVELAANLVTSLATNLATDTISLKLKNLYICNRISE